MRYFTSSKTCSSCDLDVTLGHVGYLIIFQCSALPPSITLTVWVFPTAALHTVMFAAVKPDSPDRRLRQRPSAATDRIRGTGEAHPVCRSGHAPLARCRHPLPFTAPQSVTLTRPPRSGGVSGRRYSSRRRHEASINTTALVRIC